MQVLIYLICLVLPWAMGALWLRWAKPFPRQTAGTFSLLAGYGFFFGVPVACLLLWVTARYLGYLSVFAVLFPILLLAALAWWLSRDRAGQGNAGSPAAWRDLGSLERLLLAVCGALAILHIAFSLIEILTMPLFPWDAWTVWVYRAKAWFYQDQLFEFVNRNQWLNADGGPVYNQPALAYPLLPSLMPLWAAMSLGRWHESLINLPVFFCGLAIALSVFGQLRNLGFGLAWSALAIYLLVSTPIFAIHMSLGGYADIWLAGFAGLGFVALISAAYSGWRAGYVLGFVLLLIGTQVKVEGLVWLVAACAWLVLAFASRRWLWTAAATLLVATGLVLFMDTIKIPIPGAGQFVWSGNKFYLPLLGWRVLQVNDLREAYFNNVFLLGSWNLVWPALLFATVAATLARRRAALRPLLSFVLVLVASQVVIFVFSTEGAWARDYTAINRLPLQVYPAVVFVLLLLAREFLPARAVDGWSRNDATLAGYGRHFTLSAALGSLAALLVVAAWLQASAPRGPAPPLAVGANQLTFVLGSGEKTGEGLRIDGFQDGLALLTSGPVDLDAGRYSLLEVALRIDPDTVYPDESPAFFWRTAKAGAQVSRITLTDQAVFNLSASPDWNGQIVEVGFVFPATQRAASVLGQAQVKTPGLGDRLRLLPLQWLEFEPWTQSSAHVRTGGAEIQLVWLPLLVIGWLLAGATFVLLLGRRGQRAPLIVTLLFIGWLLLDAQWLHNRALQFALSIESLTRQSIDERIGSSVLGQYHPWLSVLNQQLLEDGEDRILIVSDPTQHKYYGLRAKYQLLPHMSVTSKRVPQGEALEKVDYVLFLGTFMPPARGGDTLVLRERMRALPLERKTMRQLELVDFNEQGMLFKVAPGNAR